EPTAASTATSRRIFPLVCISCLKLNRPMRKNRHTCAGHRLIEGAVANSLEKFTDEPLNQGGRQVEVLLCVENAAQSRCTLLEVKSGRVNSASEQPQLLEQYEQSMPATP